MEEQSYNMLWQVIATDDKILKLFIEMANLDGMSSEAVVKGTIGDACNLVASSKPRVLFVQEQIGVSISIYKQLANTCKLYNVKMVLIGERPKNIHVSSDNTEIGLNGKQVIEIGFDDYLNLPINVKELHQCINTIMSSIISKHDKNKDLPTKIFLVVGASAGVGTSTFAFNLATLLASSVGKKCLLMDFDTYSNNLEVNFGLKPKNSLTSLINDPSRIDSSLISLTSIRLDKNLSVLSGYNPGVITNQKDSVGIKKIISVVDGNVDYIVVDCCIDCEDIRKIFLKVASEIFLVSDLSKGAHINFRQLIAQKYWYEIPGKLHLVINNREPEKSYSLDLEDFTSVYQFHDHLVLPYCGAAMQEANIEGEVLAKFEEDHKYIEAIKGYLEKINLSKMKWWHKLFALVGVRNV